MTKRAEGEERERENIQTNGKNDKVEEREKTWENYRWIKRDDTAVVIYEYCVKKVPLKLHNFSNVSYIVKNLVYHPLSQLNHLTYSFMNMSGGAERGEGRG